MAATQDAISAPIYPTGRRPARAGRRLRILAAPAIVYLAIFYFVPLIYILTTSITNPKVGFGNFGTALDAINSLTLLKTIGVSLVCTAIVAVLGYPLAYVINNVGPRLRMVLALGVISPYMTSVLVRTFAWEVILGRLGPLPELLRLVGLNVQSLLQTWTGLGLGLIQVCLPLFILPVFSTMRGIDQSSVRAARSHGAGRAETFCRIFFPQTLPGIEVGLILTFVSMAGSFVLPVVLGGQSSTMTGVVINNQLNQEGAWGAASATAIVLSVAIFIGIMILRLFGRRQREWLSARAGDTVVHKQRRGAGRLAGDIVVSVARFLDKSGLSRWRWPWLVLVVVLEVYLFVPQLISIPVSFSGTQTLVFPPHGLSLSWYREFATPQWTGPLWTSLVVAPTAAVVATLLGALAAIGLERIASARTRNWIAGMMLTPIIVPLIVAAVGFYLVLERVNLVDTLSGLILSETSIVIPIAFIVCQASVQSLDPAYERAANSLGARRVRVLQKILFPLIRPALVVSMLFAFLFVFDEVVLPIFITAVYVNVLPKQMYQSLAYASDPTIAVVGVLSLAMSGAVLALSLVMQRRSRTSALGSLPVGGGISR